MTALIAETMGWPEAIAAASVPLAVAVVLCTFMVCLSAVAIERWPFTKP